MNGEERIQVEGITHAKVHTRWKEVVFEVSRADHLTVQLVGSEVGPHLIVQDLGGRGKDQNFIPFSLSSFYFRKSQLFQKVVRLVRCTPLYLHLESSITNILLHLLSLFYFFAISFEGKMQTL